jgi:hypothetical protein
MYLIIFKFYYKFFLLLGAFDLQEEPYKIIQRLLEILQQFLISDKNVDLEINNTLKVYINVLSIHHMRFKAQNPRKKQVNKRKKNHYGTYKKSKSNSYWMLDVPNGYKNNPSIFKNKCLITSVILGVLQNSYYKSQRQDKRFLYVQNINSALESKQIHAGNILKKELQKVLNDLSLTDQKQELCLEVIGPKLSEYFSCQIFIFDGINNSSKLKYLFPPIYNHELQPIYLFEPFQNKNHLIFIKCLSSYFKANVKVCFTCQKTFKTYNYKHRCSFNLCCFACRCIFASEKTYLHEKLQPNFCDGKITTERSFLCNICNVTLYSKKCEKAHRLLCNGLGNFGWKCLSCNHFTYRHGSFNSKKLSEIHQCGIIVCSNCHQHYNEDEQHLCKLRKESISKKWPLLAFFNCQFLNFNSSNCAACYEQKEKFKTENNLSWKEVFEHLLFPSLKCDYHEIEDNTFLHSNEANVIVLYKENIENKGHFSKHIFTNLNVTDFVEKDILQFDYVNSDIKISSSKQGKLRKTEDLMTNLAFLEKENEENLSATKKFLKFICSGAGLMDVTLICQDSESIILVRTNIESFAPNQSNIYLNCVKYIRYVS